MSRTTGRSSAIIALLAAFAAAVMTLFLARTARSVADGPGSPGYGRALAEQICGECHRVSAAQPRGGPSDELEPADVLPDLTEVMQDSGMTAIALHSFLRTSHPSMPNIRLTPEQTDDIVAYLLTLKGSAR